MQYRGILCFEKYPAGQKILALESTIMNECLPPAAVLLYFARFDPPIHHVHFDHDSRVFEFVADP
jgi:hypothetical protein